MERTPEETYRPERYPRGFYRLDVERETRDVPERVILRNGIKPE